MMNDGMMLLLQNLAVLFPAFLFVFTARGFFRALVAKLMGDDTAQREGFLTLNPVAHVDVLGLCVVFFVIFFLGALFGGGFPRAMLYIVLIFMGVRWTHVVPFDERNFRRLKLGAILTILSGSIGCFSLVYLFLYLFKYMPFFHLSLAAYKSLNGIVLSVISLAAYFGVLDLLPIPPFNGGRLLQFILPYSKQHIVAWLEEYSMFILIALFVLPVVSDAFFGMISVLGNSIVQFLSMLVL